MSDQAWNGEERRSADRERHPLYDLLSRQDEKLDRLAEQFGGIHAEQHSYIAKLIAREERRMAFREAVIEKTTASLVWSMLVGLAIASWTYLKEHLK